MLPPSERKVYMGGRLALIILLVIYVGTAYVFAF